MKKFTLIVLIGGMILWLIMPASRGLALEEYPGSFQFGDSGTCDGIISAADLITIKTVIAGGVGNYSGCTPPVKDIQDLDGDRIVSPSDLVRLSKWAVGNFTDPTGVGLPHAIYIESNIFLSYEGTTVDVVVSVYDDPNNGDMKWTLRPGWGVIFEIVSNDCPVALLYGRDITPVVGGGKNQYVLENSVFEYTDSFANFGLAWAFLLTEGCMDGDQVSIRVHIPSDPEAGFASSKLMTPIYLGGDMWGDCCYSP